MRETHRLASPAHETKEAPVPRIVIETDTNSPEATILLAERVVPAQIESEHFCDQLIERVGWAILDAEDAELGRPPARLVARP